MESGPAGTRGAVALQKPGERWERPLLIELVAEASRSLASLDAERLEELALSCQALNRDLAQADAETRALLASEAKEATSDMAVLAKVLEATRANLNVMNRLRELRGGRLEYGAPQAPGWPPMGSGHGNN
jgi:cell division protein FtsB